MRNSILILTLMLGIMIIGCKEDPVVIDPPVANFTFTVDGKDVTFTNTSQDADSYAWDFGDGESSTSENPTHTYEANGSYVVKLTVTNGGGDDSKQEVLEIINIAIDGSLSDWDDVPEAITGAGTVKVIKLENLDNNKLFVYIEGNEELTDLTQILMNTDNDRTTGAFIDWFYFQAGEDIIIEGNLPAGDDQYASIYECSPCDGSSPGNWNWGATPLSENIADFIVASSMISVPGGRAYEISIDLTALGKPINDTAIGIAVLDVSLDTWGPVGSAPMFYNENDNPEGTLFTYTFK